MRARRRLLATLAASLPAALAPAQSIDIEVSTPNAAFAIGDPIPISLIARWTGGVQLASAQGSVIVTPASGSAGNLGSHLEPSALVNLGTINGFSCIGIDVFSVPPMFTGGFVIPPWGNSTGLTIVQYEIQTLEPGFYYARWVPDAANQGVSVYANTTGPGLLNAPVSNISTRFFVGCCPGPGCAADLTHSANPADIRYGVPNGVLNNEDFFFYLARFAANDRGVCDVTASAVPGTPGYGFPNAILNNDDFFYYLAIFAHGC